MAPDHSMAIISADWLFKAPHLIRSLGLCISLAATREASQIRLSSSELERKDLASNLVALASQGQNAFIEAYSDMIQIGMKTNNMGRISGIIDQVVDLFGDPTAERATKRLLERLQSDLKVCDENGKRTDACFTSWQCGVLAVHNGVIAAQNETTQGLVQTIKAMDTLQVSKAQTGLAIETAQVEKTTAHERHDAALRKLKSREAQLTSYACPQFGLAFSFGTIGAAVGVGTALYLSASASSTASDAEDELDRQRRLARDLDLKLKNVEIDLDMFATEQRGLDHLLQAMVVVLELLAGLTRHIKSLVMFFTEMNAVIAELVNEHDSQLKQIAEDLANDEQLSAADFKSFRASALQMKKDSLVVHSLSALYAKVIMETINPGFALAVESSHYAHGETALVVTQKKDKLQQYLVDSEKMCRSFATEADRTLRGRLLELESAAATKKYSKRPPQRHRSTSDTSRRGFNLFRR